VMRAVSNKRSHRDLVFKIWSAHKSWGSSGWNAHTPARMVLGSCYESCRALRDSCSESVRRNVMNPNLLLGIRIALHVASITLVVVCVYSRA